MKKISLAFLVLCFAFPAFSQEDITLSGALVSESDEAQADLFGSDTSQSSKSNAGMLIAPKLVSAKQDAKAQKNIQLNANQSLSENIKKNAPDKLPEIIPDEIEVPQNSKNWVGELLSNAKNKLSDNNGKSTNALSEMLEESKIRNMRSNAAVFDISGVMLRMSYKQAEDVLKARGYKKTSVKMDIPNFIRWRNEETCRNQGVYGFERLENCIVQLSRKENHQFISHAQFNKYETKETLQIFLTSSFTSNKIYKIVYQTEAAKVPGYTEKANYLRNIKVYDFWKKINLKYGVPDNKEEVLWGLGDNKPYMKAATGYLLLEDPMLRELDYTRMSREDQRFLNTDLYTF